MKTRSTPSHAKDRIPTQADVEKNVRTTRSFTTSHGTTTTGLAVVDPWDVVARPRPVFSVFSANFATYV